MVGPLEKPLVSPILVGREPYLHSLNNLIAQARAGRGQIALLCGEAGLGKSRLVAEAKARALEQGFLSVQGNCFEPDRALPYAPFADLLRAFCVGRSTQALAQAMGATARELVKLSPELAARLPEVTPAPAREPEQERRRLFEALAQFFVQLMGAQQPLLIVVEDVHWADEASLEFLLYLARAIASQPILLLITYRGDETQTTPGLRHWLAELDRARLATELNLTPLSAADVDAMIRSIFHQTRPVRAEFVNAVHALTDGNPFFVEEVLKSLVAAGEIFWELGGWTRKPLDELHTLRVRSVQDAVARRTAQLSEDARQLLTLAAVAGRRFDFELLPHLTGRGEAELLALIKELIAAQLVVEESAKGFAFRHALTRQAVYTGLLAREQRALHRVVAETMERVYAGSIDAHLSDLAYQFFAAGVWEKALLYSQRAGERAQRLYAPRAAAEHYTHALEAARQLSLAPPLELVRARGQMLQTLGELDAARADFETALHEAQARGDRQAEWQALMDLGFLWASRDYTRTGEYFRQALALAHGLADSATLAHNLNRVGNWHLNVGQPREAERYHQEALRIFESLDDPRGLAATLDLLGITLYVSSDVYRGLTYYERAMALFEALGDRGGLASSLVIYASRGADYIGNTAVPVVVPFAERVRASERALALALETEARPAETINTLWLGLCLAGGGQFGRALEKLQRGLALAEAIEHHHFRTVAHMLLGMLHVDLLALPAACAHLEQALTLARDTRSAVWTGTATGFLATACIQQGELARAEAVLNAGLVPVTPMDALGERQMWCARAELALAQGEAEAALQIVEQLIASAPNIDAAGEHAIPRLSRLRGEALTALGRYAQAEAVLNGALAAARSLELRPEVWRLYASLGRLRLAQDRREQMDDAYAIAHALVEELATTLPDAGLRENFVRRAAERMPAAPPLTVRQAAKREYGGLTGREREVAALIAQGKSNREIAEALVLSNRTVEAHISHILSKLGFASRSQIAVWAAERGLAKDGS